MKAVFYKSLRNACRAMINLAALAERKINRKIFLTEFEQRESDIYIVTYMKSGTTLLQVILHQLLTDGDMSYRHIYQVSPFLEAVIARGYDIHSKPSPRIIKTHLDYHIFPARLKGKMIYCTRNGMDVAVSKFHHLQNYADPKLEWNEFVEKTFMTGKGEENKTWFQHVAEWKKNNNGFDILYISYEDLISSREAVVNRIAAFLGYEITPEIMQRVLHESSFEQMKLNQEKFGERPPDEGLVYDQFIRKGVAGEGDLKFTATQKDKYRERYLKYLGE